MRHVGWMIAGLCFLGSPVWAITLAWDPSLGATGYRLSYGRVSGVYDTVVDTGSATSASLGGLIVGETYFFAASAYNTSGASGYSNEVHAVISGAPPTDTTPPSLEITSPADGSTVPRRGRVTITADAVDPGGVNRVEFLVNGRVQCSDTSAPYTCSWNVPAPPGRTYQLSAEAVDMGGNRGTSATITVISR
jgi:chitinase